MTDKLLEVGAKVLWNKKDVSYGIVTSFLDPDDNFVEILLENNS